MPLATLSIDLEARLAKLEEGLSKAGRLAEKSADRIEKRFSAVSAAASSLAGLVVGAFAGISLVAFTKSSLDAIDALNDVRDATGASVENLSALQDLGERTGTAFETVASVLVKFNDELRKTKPDDDMSRTLKAIGLDAAELKKVDPAEALRRVAVAFEKFEDSGSKARAMQMVFGRSVQDAAPFLKDLAEQGELNAKVTTEQAEQVERFNKQILALQTNLSDLTRDLSLAIIPKLNEFLEKLKALREAGGFWESIGNDFKANFISEQLRVVVAEIESLQKAMDRWGSDPFLEKKMAALRAEAARLSREALNASAALKGFSDKVQPLPETTLPTVTVTRPRLPDIPSGKPDKKDPPFVGPPTFATVYGEELAKLVQDNDLARAQKYADLLKQLDDAYFSGAMSGEEYDAAVKKVSDSTSTASKVTSEFLRDQQRLAELIDAGPAATLQRQRKDMELLTKAYLDGRFGIVGTAEAIKAYGDIVNHTLGNTAKLKEELDAMSVFAEQAGRNIQDALGDTLSRTLKGDFDSIGEMWGNLLLDMAAQAMAVQLNQYLFGKFDEKSGSWSGALGPLMKGFMGLFAEGGTLGAGQWGIAGEAGPEVVKGPAQIIPVAQLARGGGGGLTYVDSRTIYIGSNTSRNEVMVAMHVTKEQAKAEMADMIRRGRVFP